MSAIWAATCSHGCESVRLVSALIGALPPLEDVSSLLRLLDVFSLSEIDFILYPD